MLCPNCGTKATTTHKFCRGCGMNLAPVSEALAAHLSPGGAASAREAERRAARRMRNGLLVGVFVVLLGALVMTVLSGKGFTLIGLLTILLGVVFSLAAVLPPLRAAARVDEDDAPPPSEDAAATQRLLHENTTEPAASVAERTTELLGVERKVAEPGRD